MLYEILIQSNLIWKLGRFYFWNHQQALFEHSLLLFCPRRLTQSPSNWLPLSITKVLHFFARLYCVPMKQWAVENCFNYEIFNYAMNSDSAAVTKNPHHYISWQKNILARVILIPYRIKTLKNIIIVYRSCKNLLEVVILQFNHSVWTGLEILAEVPGAATGQIRPDELPFVSNHPWLHWSWWNCWRHLSCTK